MACRSVRSVCRSHICAQHAKILCFTGPTSQNCPFPGGFVDGGTTPLGPESTRRQMAPRSVYLLLQGSRLWPTDRRKNRQTTERQDSWSNRVRLRIMHAMRPKIVTSLLHQLLVWRQCKQIWRMMPCFELNARSVSMVHFGTVSYHQTDSSWIHVIAHYDDYVTYTVCDNRLRLRYVG